MSIFVQGFTIMANPTRERKTRNDLNTFFEGMENIKNL